MSISLNGDGIVSGVSTLTTPLTGITTFSSVDATSVVVGSAVTINSSGINIGVSTFYGDASGLTNVPAGSSVTGDFTITNGNVVVSDGYGIDFSADGNVAGMTSELLDDYEEGTWTPTIFGASVTGTTTYDTFQRGNYVKIGSLVSVRIFVRISGATGSGQLKIGGFPFTSSEPNDSGCFLFTSGLNWGGGTCLWFDFPGNRTAGEVYYLADDASATAQSITNEASDFRFSFSYITSS